MGLRGPFDFIGNWIQGSDWFPIEINVPDTFGAVGNVVGNVAQGVGSFAQGVGSNINGFAQNVGQGFQTFSQNFGNGFQNLGQLFSQRPNSVANVQPAQPDNGQKNPQTEIQQAPSVGAQQKYFILMPMNMASTNSRPIYPFLQTRNKMPFDNDMLLEVFP